MLLLFMLAIYPLIAPWKRFFIIAWFIIWIGWWGFFFFLADFESEHLTKGIISGTMVIGVFIALFVVASLIRLLIRRVFLE